VHFGSLMCLRALEFCELIQQLEAGVSLNRDGYAGNKIKTIARRV